MTAERFSFEIQDAETLTQRFERMHSASRGELMPSAGTRERRLGALKQMLLNHMTEWEIAISADFGYRSAHETRLEAFSCLDAIRHSRRHLKRWVKPQRRDVALTFRPGSAEIRHHPLGVIGIVVPWNYPIFLSFGPLVDALAAGNRALVKMSEYSPHCSTLFAKLAAQYFAADELGIVGGDVALAEAFSRLPFDHLFFTGSSGVGRRVMQSAAANLTPVTLELGGKSPVIVAADYPLAHAAERIVAGKFLNAGQTCVAPDYVLIPKAQTAAFIDALRAQIARCYGDLAHCPDYSNIINERQYARLAAYLDDARSHGAEIVELSTGAQPDPVSRRMPPFALLNVHRGLRVMREEIFGPLLPILNYDSLEDAIAFINAGDRPLALYIFDRDHARVNRVLDNTVAGGVTVNDTVLHLAQHDLPFGGVGQSGMGHYHGHDGFLTFSKQISVYRQSRWNMVSLFNPPYTAGFDRLLNWLMQR